MQVKKRASKAATVVRGHIPTRACVQQATYRPCDDTVGAAACSNSAAATGAAATAAEPHASAASAATIAAAAAATIAAATAATTAAVAAVVPAAAAARTEAAAAGWQQRRPRSRPHQHHARSTIESTLRHAETPGLQLQPQLPTDFWEKLFGDDDRQGRQLTQQVQFIGV